MTRDKLVAAANALVALQQHPKLRTVVVVTDESGDFVGVSANTPLDDVERILKCALYKEGLVFHSVEENSYVRGKRSRRSDAAPAPKARKR